MYNLLQIQDALKGLTPDQVMKYADGTNPNVPSYLALSELNRRKQLQDTSSEFYGQPTTVKDQIAGSFTQAPQGVNPAAAPAQVNPAAPPPQLAVQQPPPTQAPPQVNPAAAPPQFAQGGLTSLPVSMFKQANYAGGGIVAFADGGAAAQRQGALDVLKTNMPDIPSDYRGSLTEYLSNPENAQAYEANQRDREIARKAILSNNPLPSLNRDILNPSQSIRAQADEQKPEAPKEVAKEEPTGIKSVVNPNQQSSNTTSGQLPPVRTVQEKPVPQDADEKMFARNERLNKLAGIEGDPYADLKKRYAGIEDKRATQAEQDPMDRLIAQLVGIGSAAPEKGFGYAMGQGAIASQTMQKDQAALRDKQESEMATLQGAIAKEELSRKQGNVKGVIDAQKEQRDTELKMRKLDIDEQVARAQMAHYSSMGTNAGLKENPLVTAATKYYFENQMIPKFKKDYPTVGDYIKAQGLTTHASTSTAPPPAGNLPSTVTKDGKTYILQANGKYIEKT
jgi:hypothetical protein